MLFITVTKGKHGLARHLASPMPPHFAKAADKKSTPFRCEPLPSFRGWNELLTLSGFQPGSTGIQLDAAPHVSALGGARLNFLRIPCSAFVSHSGSQEQTDEAA